MGFIRAVGVGLVGVLIAGCAHREEVGPEILPPPKPETVTLELKPDYPKLEPRTAPVMRPTGAKPSAKQLSTIKPLLLPNTPLLITLSDRIKFDGQFPGEDGDWGAWDAEVEHIVRDNAKSKPIYEIWNEPDKKETFKGTQADFFSIWVHTARIIRKVDPKAVLMGPSVATHSWVSEFLKVCKEFDVLPDIVCFHEAAKPDMPGHVGGTSEGFWQDGSNRSVIYVSQAKSIEHKYQPSDVVLMLAQIQKAHKDNQGRPVEVRYSFKLTHLVSNKEPRPILRVYQVYAGMLGQEMLKVHAGSTIDGLATWASEDGPVTMLLGRNSARYSTTQPALGEASLQIKNIPGPGVAVTIWRVRRESASTQPTTQATQPTTQPTTLATTAPTTQPDESEPYQRFVLPAKNGEAKTILTGFGSGDALILSIQPITAPEFPKLLKETP